MEGVSPTNFPAYGCGTWTGGGPQPPPPGGPAPGGPPPPGYPPPPPGTPPPGNPFPPGYPSPGNPLCHDLDALGHGTCTTTVCLLISTLLCVPFVLFLSVHHPSKSYL